MPVVKPVTPAAVAVQQCVARIRNEDTTCVSNRHLRRVGLIPARGAIDGSVETVSVAVNMVDSLLSGMGMIEDDQQA